MSQILEASGSRGQRDAIFAMRSEMLPPFVLVAFDTAETSVWALERADLIARSNGCCTRIVHAVSDFCGQDEIAAGRQRLLLEIQKLGSTEGENTELVMRLGDAAMAVGQEAADPSCMLVVIGSSRRNFLGSMLLETTLAKILAVTQTPVLVVQAKPGRAYQRVVAAIDFEAAARDATSDALLLNIAKTANLSMVHAFRCPYRMTMITAGVNPDTLTNRMKAEISLRYLDYLQELDLARADIRLEMREGPTFSTLSHYFSKINADLVILGNRGTSPLFRRVFGSTAMGLLQSTSADIFFGRPVVD